MASKELKDIPFLDSVLTRLNTVEAHGHLKAVEINRLIKLAMESFAKQETMLAVKPPVVVMGDIHGQYRDLLALFADGGWPPATRYLFLGDYIDRGLKSIEVICLLLAFKVRFPNDVHLLRGNHESRCINRTYGFYFECVRRYSVEIWDIFQECFNLMPLCAVIGGHIFCTHGGLPRNLTSLDDIRRIKRPLEVADEGIVCDLMWGDPGNDTIGWEDNTDRGVSYLFGEDAVEHFCKTFNIDMIVRAHQVFDDGYKMFANGRLITIFSAPNYAGTYQNSAAMLYVDESLVCQIRVLQPVQKGDDDEAPSDDESALAANAAESPSTSSLWMRRTLNAVQQVFEAHGYALYHPGQPNPPKKWWRTTVKAGEAHLSYRSESAHLAPIELTVIVQDTALIFKAQVEGSAAMFEYTMPFRGEYKTETLARLDEMVRKEVENAFLINIWKATKIVPPESSGLTKTVNWFKSWLASSNTTQTK